MIMTLGLAVSVDVVLRLSNKQGNQGLRDIASFSTIDVRSLQVAV
jgi:hypothetical protein